MKSPPNFRSIKAERCFDCRYCIKTGPSATCSRFGPAGLYLLGLDTVCDDFFDRAIIHPDELPEVKEYD